LRLAWYAEELAKRKLGPRTNDVFSVHAKIDVPLRQHANAEFTWTPQGSRALISIVYLMLTDGYEVTFTSPDGASFSGSEVAKPDMMDPDLGYSPRPESADQVEFRHGTWLITSAGRGGLARACAEQQEKTVAESHERYVKSFEKDKGPSGKQT
jgi:hypothetical protein